MITNDYELEQFVGEVIKKCFSQPLGSALNNSFTISTIRTDVLEVETSLCVKIKFFLKDNMLCYMGPVMVFGNEIPTVISIPQGGAKQFIRIILEGLYRHCLVITNMI